MSLPILVNLRLLSLHPSMVKNGFFAELVLSSMAGPNLESAAKLRCEFHPQAHDGAHWGVLPAEVKYDSKFSLLCMMLGANPAEVASGEPASRFTLFTQMVSRSLNEFHPQRDVRAILPDELATLLHNTVFALCSDGGEPPLVLRPTGIKQPQLLDAMCALSPDAFGLVPSYYIEPAEHGSSKQTYALVDLRPGSVS